MDSLAYGNAGEAGEYVSTTKSDIRGTIEITLGKGGVWNFKNIEDLANGSKGKDGTSTIIKVREGSNLEKILEAKGGSGGSPDSKTDNFDMCFNLNNAMVENSTKGIAFNPKDKENISNFLCKKGDNSGEESYCCTGGVASNSTRDILSTAVKYSEFDKIAAKVNNSNIIGIGLGRSGEGIGSTTYNEELIGTRSAVNASTYKEYNKDDKIIVKNDSPNNKPGDKNYYKNYVLKPANINFAGAGGAVIIIW